MQSRSRAAYALAVGLFAVALAEVLVTLIGGAVSGLGWVRLREDLVLSNALLGLMLAVPGFLLAGHRPGNPIGWLLLGGGVGYATSAAGYVVLALGTEPGGSGLGWRLVATATNFGWPWAVGLSIPVSLLLFPTGRPLGPRWRWLVGIAVVNGVLFAMLVGLPAGGLSTSVGVEGLPGLTAPWLRTAWTWLTIPGLVIYVLGLVSLLLRYRRGDAVLRQQIGWVLFSVIALVVLQIASALWPGDDWLGVLSLGLLPVGITVAILRANLLDIRIVVSRSLLYLVLTAGVALVYLGLVAGLSWLSLGLNTGAAVLATVLIAVAFNPLRVRLQRLLDRAFYGARRDPVRALAAVGERLEVVAAPSGDGLDRGARGGLLQRYGCPGRRSWWTGHRDRRATGPRRRTGTAYRSGRVASRSASWWSGSGRASRGWRRPTSGCSACSRHRSGWRFRRPTWRRRSAGRGSGSSPLARRSGAGCAGTCTTGWVRC